MHDLLPSSISHTEFGINRHPVRGKSVTRDATRPTDIVTKKYRVVCGPCNSGWMNQIEGLAREPLSKMVTGKPFTLSIQDQLNVARWIALKIIVAENGANYPVTPRLERQQFMASMQIPACFRIYVANPTTEKMGLLRHSLTGSLPGEPAPILDAVRGNMHQTSFAVGYMFVLVHASFVEGLTFEDGINLGGLYDMRLWPLQRFQFQWPPLPFLSDSDIGVIVHSVKDNLAARTEWGGDLPEENRLGDLT